MSSTDEARKKMQRCPQGHIFNAAAHAACPICGATAPDPVKRDAPAPQPSWLRPAILVGGAIIAVLTTILLLRGAPPVGANVKVEKAKAVIAAKDEDRPAAQPTSERWRTVMVIGGRRYECVNETEPDGRYRLGAGCPPPFAGETGMTTVNADGEWTSRSDAGRIDSGTIEILDNDHIIAHTRGGPVVWERADPEN